MITEASAIAKIREDTEILTDGLFTFASQGQYIVDMCSHVTDDDDYYIVEVYESTGDQPEFFNHTHIDGEFFKMKATSSLQESYAIKSDTAFSDRAAAFAYYMSQIIELNSSAF